MGLHANVYSGERPSFGVVIRDLSWLPGALIVVKPHVMVLALMVAAAAGARAEDASQTFAVCLGQL